MILLNSFSADVYGSTHVRAIPTAKDASKGWEYLRTFAHKLSPCGNLISNVPNGCLTCGSSNANIDLVDSTTTAGWGVLL